MRGRIKGQVRQAYSHHVGCGWGREAALTKGLGEGPQGRRDRARLEEAGGVGSGGDLGRKGTGVGLK